MSTSLSLPNAIQASTATGSIAFSDIPLLVDTNSPTFYFETTPSSIVNKNATLTSAVVNHSGSVAATTTSAASSETTPTLTGPITELTHSFSISSGCSPTSYLAVASPTSTLATVSGSSGNFTKTSSTMTPGVSPGTNGAAGPSRYIVMAVMLTAVSMVFGVV